MRQYSDRTIIKVERTRTATAKQTIPSGALRTIFPLISGQGSQDYGISPVDAVPLCRSAVTYSETESIITMPSLFTISPMTSASDMQFRFVNEWLPIIQATNAQEPLMSRILRQDKFAGEALRVNQRSNRISAQFDLFRRKVRKIPLYMRASTQAKELQLYQSLAGQDDLVEPLEEWFEIWKKWTTSTPPQVQFAPIGLAPGKYEVGKAFPMDNRPSTFAELEGYKRVFKASNLPAIIDRGQHRLVVDTFTCFCLMTGQSRTKFNGEDLTVKDTNTMEQVMIDYGFFMYSCIKNGVYSKSWEEFLDSIPILNRRKVLPNLAAWLAPNPTKLEPHKLPLLADFLYSFYMFQRYLGKLLEAGFQINYDTVEFKYSAAAAGDNRYVPSKSEVDRAFDVFYRVVSGSGTLGKTREYATVASGDPIWFIPKTSDILNGQMSFHFRIVNSNYDPQKKAIDSPWRNRWHDTRMPKTSPVRIRSDPIPVASEVPIVPDLMEEKLEHYILNFESQMEIGLSTPILRIDEEPDYYVISLHRGNASFPENTISRFDLPRSLLSGGSPLMNFDCLLMNGSGQLGEVVQLHVYDKASTDAMGGSTDTRTLKALREEDLTQVSIQHEKLSPAAFLGWATHYVDSLGALSPDQVAQFVKIFDGYRKQKVNNSDLEELNRKVHDSSKEAFV